MAGFGFRKNMVFKWNGTTFRIDRLQPNGEVLLERLDDGQFSIVSRSTLLAEYGNCAVTAAVNEQPDLQCSTTTYSRPLDELPSAVQAEVQRRRHYIKFILDKGEPVFVPSYLKPVIQQAAESINDKTPPSVTSVYRWFRRYRTSDDTRALIPRVDLRGSKSMRQGNRLLELVAEAVEDAYKASPLATGPTIYTRLLAKIEAENHRALGGELLKPPTMRTLYRILGRVDAYDRTQLREGKAAADKRFRGVGLGVKTQNILERVEIDHTPLDLFLIDEKTCLPLGRPTLTVAIDHYSRMLLGYYLSFGDPSAAAVMGALRHAILPKSLSNEALQSLKFEHGWPSYGRPDVIVVDNGLEFHGNDLESVAFDLDISIHFCPKHQPRFKGVVERYLKTINYYFCHQLPGTSFSRLHQRGDYDPQKCALLTLAEFKHLFEKWVVDVYAQTKHRGIGTTPWVRWHEGLRRREPELPSDLLAFQRRIGLVDERSLRRDGIFLHGIRYNGDTLAPILRAYGEGIRVRVLYDPEDLGEIQVWGPNDALPVTVLALDQGYAKGLTVLQNQSIRTLQRENGSGAENAASLQRARNELVQVVEDLMSSRKQRDRRRAAAIRGQSSNRPDRDLKPAVTTDELPRLPEPPIVPAVVNSLTTLPPVLQAFQLRSDQGGRP